MNIRYIYIGSDTTFPDKDFWNIFCYNTRFISNWMSRKVRLLKIPTDGTFNHISVYISPKEDKCKVDGKGIFLVPLHWIEEDIVQYLNMKDENERISLYLDLLREGLKKAAQIKEIHIIELLSMIDSFQEGGCKNEWLFKSKTIRERNIRTVFFCYFTTYAFELKLFLYDNKKNLIAEKIVFRIYPDEVFFQSFISQVTVDEDFLYIDTNFGKHLLSFRIRDLENGMIRETLLYEGIKKYAYDSELRDYRLIEWKDNIIL